MSDIKWIKITTNIFDDEKIRLIETLPEADTLLIIWLKLLTMAGRCNDSGIIYLARDIPYNDEMLSTILRRPINVIRLALDQFKKLQMIEIENDFIAIINWEKHQNIEGMEKIKEQNRIRQQKHREGQKKIGSNVMSRDNNATDKIRIDKIRKEYIPEIQELFKTWISLGLSQHKEEVVKREIKQAHVDSFKQFPLNIWKKMISDYQIVYDSSKYYYTHWFTFWDFIARGYKKFLPEQKPLVNFLIKGQKNTTFRDQANSRYFNSLTEAEKKEYIEKRSKNKLLE